MGCWNGTCGVSRLPIRNNEPIRLVILTGVAHRLLIPNMIRDPATWQPDIKQLYVDKDGVKHELASSTEERKIDLESCTAKRLNDGWRSSWFSGFCHTIDLFCPRTVPIKGKYNDYGSIHKLDAGLNQLAIVDQNQDDLDEYPEGRFRIPHAIKKDMPLIATDPQEQGFLQAIERGGVTVKGDGNGRQPLAAWMVREDIYQAMLTSKLPGRFYSGPLEISSFYAAAEAYKTELIDQASRPPIEDLLKDADLDRDKRYEIFKTFNERRGSSNPLVQVMQAPMFERGLNFYDRWMINNIRSGRIDPNSDDLTGLLREIAEFSFFSICMDRMRVAFMPQCGAGSQDGEVEVHAIVAMETLKIIESKFENEEDEDDYEGRRGRVMEYRPCVRCGHILHTGEAKVSVALSTDELAELIETTLNLRTRARLLCALGLLDPEKERNLR
jgi:hypothetical protein